MHRSGTRRSSFWVNKRIGMASGTNGTAGKSDRLHRGHRPSGQIGE
jgi:hypothetical protein